MKSDVERGRESGGLARSKQNRIISLGEALSFSMVHLDLRTLVRSETTVPEYQD